MLSGKHCQKKLMSDDLVWQIISHGFCACKIETASGQTFCKDEYNVTGLFNRQSCPLANSTYATVRNLKGRLYLCIKTPERKHTPAKLWQHIRLSQHYLTGLKQIDEHLKHWDKFFLHNCKKRFTKLKQITATERRLALREEERHYVGVHRKQTRREQTRERKALAAAKVEQSIEQELLRRLQSGAYSAQEPLNVHPHAWKWTLASLQEIEWETEWDQAS